MLRNSVRRYAAWIDAHRVEVLILSVVIALACGVLGSKLAIKSDLSTLLPSSQRSVQDVNKMKLRARPFGTVHVVIESQDPARRAAVSAALKARFARFGPDRVVSFSPDDAPLYRYAWQHRFLLAKLSELEAGRDALRERIERGKLAANPLFIQLDEDERPARDDRFTDLERRLTELEEKAASPPPRVSQDGTIELLVLQTAFATSAYEQVRALLADVRVDVDEVLREAGPGVHVGLTGNATNTLAEHDSLLEGMTLSILVTVALCAAALWLYYRSGKLVLAMMWSLAVGVTATFAVALALIGHLDMMSAFLAAIVIGNGINPALILVARYLEEVRGGCAPVDAVAPAVQGALHGTLGAAATAAIAYLSLLSTDFLGFRNFGAIAGAGMALTWLTAFTVLPAALFVLARRGAIKAATRPPAIGLLLSKLLPRRNSVVVALGALLVAGSIVVTTRFIVNDPFTKDWRALQSSTPGIRDARQLDARLRKAFEGQSLHASQAYQVAIAVEDRAQVAPVVASIRAANAARPERERWLQDIRSLDDLVPADQPQKLEVLKQIRELLDDPALQASLDPAEREQLAKVRPPDDLAPVKDTDVPGALVWPFVEHDGSIGKLAVLRGSTKLSSFNVADRVRFANEIRALELPAGTLAASESLVVADIIETMQRDAPWMIGFALAGSMLAVLLVIGFRRHGFVTLGCGLAGVIVMIAMCAIAGLSVHFLDLIALPITIGIGIDYAVNLAVRDREEGHRGPRYLLATTGGAVLLCSYTTTVGYSTLMLSANGGIRAFGLAALLGEVACTTMALIIAPALFALLRGERYAGRADGKIDTPA